MTRRQLTHQERYDHQQTLELLARLVVAQPRPPQMQRCFVLFTGG